VPDEFSTAISTHHQENAVEDILFAEQVLAGARFVESAFWPAELTRYEGSGTCVYRRAWPAGETLLLEFEPAEFAIVFLGGGEANVRVGTRSREQTAALLAALREAIPEMRFDGERRPVAFWSDHPMGPRRVTRNLEVPAWEKVAANYPLDVAHELARLIEFRPAAAGQLLLWRGEPGTGKTWAL